MSETKLEKLMGKYQTSEEKLEDFGDLLESLSDVDEKKKLLWREIYHNAVIDRENAGMLFTDAFKQMQTGSAEHVTLGSTLTKYIERMCKSNEQILRLAEMISKNDVQSTKIDPNDLFRQIDE
jgi:hypothetical protein